MNNLNKLKEQMKHAQLMKFDGTEPLIDHEEAQPINPQDTHIRTHVMVDGQRIEMRSWHLDNPQTFSMLGRPRPDRTLLNRGFDPATPVCVVSNGDGIGEIVLQCVNFEQTGYAREFLTSVWGRPCRWMKVKDMAKYTTRSVRPRRSRAVSQ